MEAYQMPPPPRLPKEDEAIPIEPAIAAARSSFINSNIEKIKALKAQGKAKDEIQAEVPTFVRTYPSLFKMLMTDNYNEGSLNTVLAMLEKMGSEELTQHQASVIVGQRLHDVYIKPRIPEMERKEEPQ